MTALRCYCVTVLDCDDEMAILVTAKSPAQARSLAWRAEGWGCDYVDLRAKRYPAGDGYAASDPAARAWTRDGRRYRDLGWHDGDGGETCDVCELHVWYDVPESLIEDVGDLRMCSECLEGESRFWVSVGAPPSWVEMRRWRRGTWWPGGCPTGWRGPLKSCGCAPLPEMLAMLGAA